MPERTVTAAALAIVTALGSAGAQSQPISQSLAQCGVISRVTADVAQASGKRKAHNIALLREHSAKFHAASKREAEAEGRNPAYLDAIIDKTADEWYDRYSDVSRLSDSLEWLKYCRALGKSRGIVLRLK